MKKLVLFTLLIVLAVGASAQRFANKQFVLIDYELNITDEFREDLNPVKGFYNNAEVHNKEAEDRLKALFIHNLYYTMKRQLERKMELSILPINSFMNEFKYNEFGYPKGSINKAIRKGDFPYYFKVKITFDSQTKEKKENDPGLSGDITFPVIHLKITVFNDEGIIPVTKWDSMYRHQEPLNVQPELFKGWVKDSKLSGSYKGETLAQLYKKALSDLITKAHNE
jgi:hypothetical protein